MTRARWIAAGIAAVGIGLMVAGGVRGEVRTLHAKATAICLECIGIG